MPDNNMPGEVERADWSWIRGNGWRADCSDCVGSKFTCDRHYAAALTQQVIGAQGIEARSDTTRSGVAVGESPVPQECAQGGPDASGN